MEADSKVQLPAMRAYFIYTKYIYYVYNRHVNGKEVRYVACLCIVR